jgi:predicted metal-dependent phosphoesterase TrpH
MEVLAACHLHSLWSYDGSWTLDALRASLRGRGCRVLLMTEHDRGFTADRFREYRDACAQTSTEDTLLVPGIEYSDSANRVHVLVWGAPFIGEGLPTSEMLEAVRSANGLAVLAHPSRKDAWSCFESYWAERLLGIEIWNRKYDGWAPSTTAPALLEKADVVPFVGLDFHTQRQFFPLAMALDLQNGLTEDRVLECMRSRRCSARAFGVPLGEGWVDKALPAFGLVETGRKAAAGLLRSARALRR